MADFQNSLHLREQTLSSMLSELRTRLGFVAQGAASRSNEEILKSFLRDAVEFVWGSIEHDAEKRVARIRLHKGETLYDFHDDDEDREITPGSVLSMSVADGSNRFPLNRGITEADRANRFALARAGLLGGSADVESVGDINDRTNKGLLRAQGIADDSAASLKTRDENTRQSLLSLANQGIDANAASTMATNQLNSNLSGAASDKAAASVGSLFNDMAQAYLTGTAANQAANTLARQQALYQKAYGVSDPHTTYSGS